MVTGFLKKAFRHLAFAGVMGTVMLAGNSIAEASPSQCGTRTLIVQQLSSKFSETLRSRGLIHDKLLMELFASDKGTWSILFTSPQGQTCVIATGQMWIDNLHKKEHPEA